MMSTLEKTGKDGRVRTVPCWSAKAVTRGYLEAVRAGEQGPGGRPVASREAENPNHGKGIAGESKYKDTR